MYGTLLYCTEIGMEVCAVFLSLAATWVDLSSRVAEDQILMTGESVSKIKEQVNPMS